MPEPKKTESQKLQARVAAALLNAGEENAPRWLFLIPFALLAVLLVTSPNFRWQTGGVRNAPYGGDFLQEWIGGQIVASNEHQRLYDLDFVKSAQHDSSKVGFEWPPKDYFPMVYPPFYYYLTSPLAQLEYRWAVVVWGVMSTFAFSLTGLLLYRFYPACRSVFKVGFLAATCFVPWLSCLTMGQKSGILLLLFSSTFLLQINRRPFWAGVVFGLVAIKPQLGLLIGAAMIFKRQWSFVLGSGLSVGLLVGISWFLEPRLWTDYFHVIAKMGDYVQTGGYQLTDSHSLWGAMQLTLAFLNPLAVKGIAAALALGVLGLIVFGLRGKLEPTEDRYPFQFAAMVLATVLLSPHFYGYDLTIILLPLFLILANIGWRAENGLFQSILGLSIMLYVLAGSFPVITATIRFQPSLLLIGSLIFLLCQHTKTSNTPDVTFQLDFTIQTTK